MSADWFTTLQQTLFAHLPEDDPAFAVDGKRYHCRRLLEDHGAVVRFIEQWRDPLTGDLRLSWSADLEAGAFVGAIPAPVYQQMVEVAVQGIHRQRPRAEAPVRQHRFDPGRFAHRGQRSREG